MRHGLLLSIVCAVLMTGAAFAQTFDPSQHRTPLAGEPTRIMVLGAPHLSELPPTFDPATLSLLLERLQGWHPDRIMIEGLSGQQCDMLRRYKAQLPDVAATYCMDTSPAAAAAGLDVPDALAAIDRKLADWPAQPSPSQRRELALLFLAAGERAPALVQWLQLSSAERRPADRLTPELVAFLDATITRRNENYLVAAALAARLGHERVWMMDDHSADIVQQGLGEDFEKAMMSIWQGPAVDARLAGQKAVQQGAVTPRGSLAMFAHFNEPAEADRAFATDFGAAMGHDTPQLFGRRYLGWWETRNLRMAANIREVAATAVGKRILVVTGASHKGYLDAYLGMMHDVAVESPLPLLR
jgi:hypothetical protein